MLADYPIISCLGRQGPVISGTYGNPLCPRKRGDQRHATQYPQSYPPREIHTPDPEQCRAQSTPFHLHTPAIRSPQAGQRPSAVSRLSTNRYPTRLSKGVPSLGQ